MEKEEKLSIFLGAGEIPQNLLLKYANRHGLIAGATGTGKTVSLQIMAEAFSKNGVPVFLSDVKGDLSGISQSGKSSPRLLARAETIKLKDYTFQGFPTVFWDLFGKKGHPVRTTVSEMGPLLLSRLLGLNDTQEGVLSVAFEVADDEGMLILDLKDFRSLINFVGENASKFTTEYGNVSKASIGAIQRRLLTLEQQGGKSFFGEPALDLNDFIRTNDKGQGIINILAADKLMQSPQLYATFLLWLLSELFEELPEVGDTDRPKLVFFFDEAHLMFDDAPKALIKKVEQVVRLIRSKGVGVYFISQSPLDIPEEVLGQLGNRIQHGLRAFTPKDRKTVRAVGDTFRANPKFKAADVIQDLGVGEALVSTLESKGRPSIVERTLMRPPSSRMGPATPKERKIVIAISDFGDRYDKTVDRESAYEILQEKAAKTAEKLERAAELADRDKKLKKSSKSSGRKRQTATEAGFKSMMRSVGRVLGRELVRGLLGSFLRKK
ncbi:MAG: helicase HerA-like domain-containing protein [Nitrospinales bacterium]